jgi:hypothetical protein
MERNGAKLMLRNIFCALGFRWSEKGESVNVNEYRVGILLGMITQGRLLSPP